MKNLEIIISGRVQGVCYRAFVLEKARELNINGYTMNMMNGDVKIIAVEEEGTLEIFINLIQKGPSMARVDNIETSEIIIGEEFTDFRIKY